MRQMANARQGTHSTKTRGEVRGGGKKPWRQKGTGRARQGSTRAPNWVGGGTAFGPTPHKYTQALPKKMQRLALRSALSAKAAAGEIVVLDKVAIDAPKTKTMVKMLSSLGVGRQERAGGGDREDNAGVEERQQSRGREDAAERLHQRARFAEP